MLFPHLLFAADAQTIGEGFQIETMQRFLRATQDAQLAARLLRFGILEEGSEPTHCCGWRGVDCTDGVVRGFCWKSHGVYHLTLAMDWMPPSMQHVHLNRCEVHKGIHSARLPRELRYFAMRSCTEMGGWVIPVIDLQTLPPLLEELLFIKCSLRGSINVTNLPDSLQVLCFIHVNITEMTVCNESLPHNLEKMAVTSTDSAFHIMNGLKAKDIDPRIAIGEVSESWWSTRRFSAFDAHVEMAAERIPENGN